MLVETVVSYCTCGDRQNKNTAVEMRTSETLNWLHSMRQKY